MKFQEGHKCKATDLHFQGPSLGGYAFYCICCGKLFYFSSREVVPDDLRMPKRLPA